MRPDLYKIWVVATTEFGSSIRTKSFLIGLLVMPIIMGLSIGLQMFMAKRVDTKPRTFAVIDRTGTLYPAIERAAKAYNEQAVDAKGQAIRPRLELSPANVAARTPPRPWSSPTRSAAASSTPSR